MQFSNFKIMAETTNPIEVAFDFAQLQLEIGKAHCSIIHD